MILQIHNTIQHKHDTMVTIGMTKNASNLTLLEVKRAYRPVFASLKQNFRNTRDNNKN
jgi:hypothetical protein